jgi:transposase
MSQLSDLDWREVRRMRAWALHEQGWTQRQIAEELAVSQGTVSRWFKQVRDKGGLEALRRHPAPGKQALLTEEQFAQIPELIKRGAEAFGFQGNHWTTRRFAAALQQVFGVAYHPGHVSRLLKKHYPDWRKV